MKELNISNTASGMLTMLLHYRVGPFSRDLMTPGEITEYINQCQDETVKSLATQGVDVIYSPFGSNTVRRALNQLYHIAEWVIPREVALTGHPIFLYSIHGDYERFKSMTPEQLYAHYRSQLVDAASFL